MPRGGRSRRWERGWYAAYGAAVRRCTSGEASMQRFWSNLAVQLGKRAGLVSVVGLLVTVALGLGISGLKFQTGQESYLNKGERVYKDNVVYQRLFGGQANTTGVYS